MLIDVYYIGFWRCNASGRIGVSKLIVWSGPSSAVFRGRLSATRCISSILPSALCVHACLYMYWFCYRDAHEEPMVQTAGFYATVVISVVTQWRGNAFAPLGYHGANCSQQCRPGRYGLNCLDRCQQNVIMGQGAALWPTSGHCECSDAWGGCNLSAGKMVVMNYYFFSYIGNDDIPHIFWGFWRGQVILNFSPRCILCMAGVIVLCLDFFLWSQRRSKHLFCSVDTVVSVSPQKIFRKNCNTKLVLLLGTCYTHVMLFLNIFYLTSLKYIQLNDAFLWSNWFIHWHLLLLIDQLMV